MKKSFAFGMLLASSMLVACGNGNSSAASQASSQSASASSSVASASSAAPSSSASPSSQSVSSAEQVVQKYELLGSYDELYDQFAGFEFYGALYSDGTGTMVQATVPSKGEEANVATLGDEISFKYKVEDDEGIETLSASINGARITAYKDASGNFTFKYSFTFAGSYSREATIVVSETINYETVDEWKVAVETAYGERVVEVIVNDIFTGSVIDVDTGAAYTVNMMGHDLPVSAEVQLLSDMTVKAAFGYSHEGAYVGGQKDIAGSWTVDTSTMEYIITIGESVYNVVTNDGDSTFTWTFTHEIKDEGGEVTATKNLSAVMHLVPKND